MNAGAKGTGNAVGSAASGGAGAFAGTFSGRRVRRGGQAAEQGQGAGAHAGKRALFLRAAAFDFLLVLVVAAGLAYTVSYGFESAPDLRSNVPLVAGLVAVQLVPLYAGLWSRRARIGAALAWAVVAAAIIGALAAMMSAGTAFFADGQVNDVAGNYAVFGIVVVVVTLVTFLLARRTWGVAVLLFAAVLCCGTIQFLYRDWSSAQPGTATAAVVFAGVLALFIYQRYLASVRSAQRLGRTDFGGAFAFAVFIAVAGLAVGAAVFFGVVAPMGLETPQIKPFQDYFQRPVIEYTGVYQEQSIDNPDLTTDQTNDTQEDTDQNAEGSQSDQENDQQQNPLTSMAAQAMSAFDPSNWNQQFQTVSYQIDAPTIVGIVLLVAAAAAAVIALRRYWRTRRLKRIAAWPAAKQALFLFNFLMGRFARLKIEKPPHLTPLEFAMASRSTLAPFARNDRAVDFVQVTLIYQRAAYGAGNVDASDLADLRSYYRGFYRAAYRESGKLKWALWRFWRL